MNVRKTILLLLTITTTVAALNAPQRAKPGLVTKPPSAAPTWLDTVPPRIEIQPRARYHNAVFQFTLASNKQAAIWYSLDSPAQMKQYTNAYTVTREGVCKVYFYGEDDLGNKSRVDSASYVLDRTAPVITLEPPPGSFPKGTVVHFKVNKPCRRFLASDPQDTLGTALPESLAIVKNIAGYIVAIDSAGNRAATANVNYSIDTTSFAISVSLPGGVYNKPQKITFSAGRDVAVYFTFDPLSSPKWFTQYNNYPILLPTGLSLLRYYGRDSAGIESGISQMKYILDTVPPKIRMDFKKGRAFDTLILFTKKRAAIHYTMDGRLPTLSSPPYTLPFTLEHKGMYSLKAIARDEAGNESEMFEWNCKYDTVPPLLSITPSNGVFTKPQHVFMALNKPGQILYTLDGSLPDSKSQLYTSEGILLSREDSTVLRAIGVDDAGNWSEPGTGKYFLDTKPPTVLVKIEGTLQDSSFFVKLTPDEPAAIYYEVGQHKPTRSSPEYSSPIPMRNGQVLTYFAVDRAGNVSPVETMDELIKPLATAVPEAGMYNHRIHVKFLTNGPALVYWRELPDTTFVPFKDSITFNQEGSHTLEYYCETQAGLKSSLIRCEYYLDWTPPVVNISIRKGIKDSVTVLFDCSENATIYYTIDGSNPYYAPTAHTAGNKYRISKDRISILRSKDIKLAFYAEDAAGNQSPLTVYDVFRPRAVPNVPAGADRVYNRILSVSLNTYDQSSVYYERHGKSPTTSSPVFTEPLTLMKSDTIIAFVVDASGYKGTPDTFIYLIDLPPSPQFVVSTDSVMSGANVVFDASATIDNESPLSKLWFRWDFLGDGKSFTAKSHLTKVSYAYDSPGNYTPTLEVTDEHGNTARISRTIMVLGRCPEGMVSVVAGDGHGFCIDKYEYPDIRGREPQSNVSWVEAKMACIDQGKRLCTAEEWNYACNGKDSTLYPYGGKYEADKCPTEGTSPWKSGSFKSCNKFGVEDMVGNVWEWVEDRQGDYPYMAGGSYRYGKDAQCGLKFNATIATKADDVGFRCCK